MRHPELALLASAWLSRAASDRPLALVAHYRAGVPRPNEIALVDLLRPSRTVQILRLANATGGVFASSVLGRFVVAVQEGGGLSLVLSDLGKRPRRIGWVRATVVSVRWSPEARHLAVLDTSRQGHHGTVWVLAVAKGAPIRRVPSVASLAWSLDGASLVVARIRRSSSGRPIRSFSKVPLAGNERSVDQPTASRLAGSVFLSALGASDALHGKPRIDSMGDVIYAPDGRAAIVYGPLRREAIDLGDGLPPTEASVEVTPTPCRLIRAGRSPVSFVPRAGFTLVGWRNRTPLFASDGSTAVFTVDGQGGWVAVRSPAPIKGVRWYWPTPPR